MIEKGKKEEKGERKGQREREVRLLHLLLLKGPQEPGIDEAKARSLELSLGPPCKHLGHVLMPSQMHQ